MPVGTFQRRLKWSWREARRARAGGGVRNARLPGLPTPREPGRPVPTAAFPPSRQPLQARSPTPRAFCPRARPGFSRRAAGGGGRGPGGRGRPSVGVSRCRGRKQPVSRGGAGRAGRGRRAHCLILYILLETGRIRRRSPRGGGPDTVNGPAGLGGGRRGGGPFSPPLEAG